jgi:molybdopterin synthase sulfur carrier subunit
MMKIQLRFFASVREKLACSTEELVVPHEVTSLAQLRAYLVQRGEVWEQTLGAHKALRMAQNQVMCHADTLLIDGAEVAFFPPVTGG